MSSAATLPLERPARHWTARAPFVFVTGGKGGVGKTLVAANLALELARRGKRVLLADLDLALSNLNVLLRLPGTRSLEPFRLLQRPACGHHFGGHVSRVGPDLGRRQILQPLLGAGDV